MAPSGQTDLGAMRYWLRATRKRHHLNGSLAPFPATYPVPKNLPKGLQTCQTRLARPEGLSSVFQIYV
jgi:hypothetical protein